jgi:hypothetical protein
MTAAKVLRLDRQFAVGRLLPHQPIPQSWETFERVFGHAQRASSST